MKLYSKKLLALVLSIALSVSVFTGCLSFTASAEETSSQIDTSSQMIRVMNRDEDGNLQMTDGMDLQEYNLAYYQSWGRDARKVLFNQQELLADNSFDVKNASVISDSGDYTEDEAKALGYTDANDCTKLTCDPAGEVAVIYHYTNYDHYIVEEDGSVKVRQLRELKRVQSTFTPKTNADGSYIYRYTSPNEYFPVTVEDGKYYYSRFGYDDNGNEIELKFDCTGKSGLTTHTDYESGWRFKFTAPVYVVTQDADGNWYHDVSGTTPAGESAYIRYYVAEEDVHQYFSQSDKNSAIYRNCNEVILEDTSNLKIENGRVTYVNGEKCGTLANEQSATNNGAVPYTGTLGRTGIDTTFDSSYMNTYTYGGTGCYIDLGAYYVITDILYTGSTSSFNNTFSIGDPGEWYNIYSDTGSAYGSYRFVNFDKVANQGIKVPAEYKYDENDESTYVYKNATRYVQVMCAGGTTTEFALYGYKVGNLTDYDNGKNGPSYYMDYNSKDFNTYDPETSTYTAGTLSDKLNTEKETYDPKGYLNYVKENSKDITNLNTTGQSGGVNGLYNNRTSNMVDMGNFREFVSLYQMVSDDGTVRFQYAQSQNNLNYDKFYTKLTSLGVQVNSCLQFATKWMCNNYLYTGYGGSRAWCPVEVEVFDTKNEGMSAVAIDAQLATGVNDEDPVAYARHASFSYNYAARYGTNTAVDPQTLSYTKNLITNGSSNPVSEEDTVGLGLMSAYENGNEQNKNWQGERSYYTAQGYAALCSADYDAHESTVYTDNDGNGYKLIPGKDGKTYLSLEDNVVGYLDGWTLHLLEGMNFVDVQSYTDCYLNTYYVSNGIAYMNNTQIGTVETNDAGVITLTRDRNLHGTKSYTLINPSHQLKIRVPKEDGTVEFVGEFQDESVSVYDEDGTQLGDKTEKYSTYYYSGNKTFEVYADENGTVYYKKRAVGYLSTADDGTQTITYTKGHNYSSASIKPGPAEYDSYINLTSEPTDAFDMGEAVYYNVSKYSAAATTSTVHIKPVGVKAADNSFLLATGGFLSHSGVDYLVQMKDWFDYNRTDGYFCVDVVNYHEYWGGSFETAETTNSRIDAINSWVKTNAPGREIWISEYNAINDDMSVCETIQTKGTQTVWQKVTIEEPEETTEIDPDKQPSDDGEIDEPVVVTPSFNPDNLIYTRDEDNNILADVESGHIYCTDEEGNEYYTDDLQTFYKKTTETTEDWVNCTSEQSAIAKDLDYGEKVWEPEKQNYYYYATADDGTEFKVSFWGGYDNMQDNKNLSADEQKSTDGTYSNQAQQLDSNIYQQTKAQRILRSNLIMDAKGADRLSQFELYDATDGVYANYGLTTTFQKESPKLEYYYFVTGNNVLWDYDNVETEIKQVGVNFKNSYYDTDTLYQTPTATSNGFQHKSKAFMDYTRVQRNCYTLGSDKNLDVYTYTYKNRKTPTDKMFAVWCSSSEQNEIEDYKFNLASYSGLTAEQLKNDYHVTYITPSYGYREGIRSGCDVADDGTISFKCSETVQFIELVKNEYDENGKVNNYTSYEQSRIIPQQVQNGVATFSKPSGQWSGTEYVEPYTKNEDGTYTAKTLYFKYKLDNQLADGTITREQYDAYFAEAEADDNVVMVNDTVLAHFAQMFDEDEKANPMTYTDMQYWYRPGTYFTDALTLITTSDSFSGLNEWSGNYDCYVTFDDYYNLDCIRMHSSNYANTKVKIYDASNSDNGELLATIGFESGNYVSWIGFDKSSDGQILTGNDAILTDSIYTNKVNKVRVEVCGSGAILGSLDFYGEKADSFANCDMDAAPGEISLEREKSLTLNYKTNMSGITEDASTITVKAGAESTTLAENEIALPKYPYQIVNGIAKIFDGWYSDSSCTIPFDENTEITKTMSIYGKWVEGSAYNQIKLTLPMTDSASLGAMFDEQDLLPGVVSGSHTCAGTRVFNLNGEYKLQELIIKGNSSSNSVCIETSLDGANWTIIKEESNKDTYVFLDPEMTGGDEIHAKFVRFSMTGKFTETYLYGEKLTDKPSYNITYDWQDGTNVKSSVLYYDETDTAASFNKNGIAMSAPQTTTINSVVSYFLGWYKTAECLDGDEVTADTVFTADTTIYAKWNSIYNFPSNQIVLDESMLSTTEDNSNPDYLGKFVDNQATKPSSVNESFGICSPVTIDLGKIYNIDQICISKGSSDYDFVVYTSIDGVNWTKLCWQNYATGGNMYRYGSTHLFSYYCTSDNSNVSRLTCRYVKYESTMNNGEIFIYGDASDAPLYGDANDDQKVSMTDMVILARYVACWDNVEVVETNCDLNKDTFVNAEDVTCLVRYLARWQDFLLLPIIAK